MELHLLLEVEPIHYETVQPSIHKHEEKEVFRARFQANAEDYRPVTFPPPHPYWCTGYAGDMSYSIVVAYVDSEDQVREFWPEADEIELGDPVDEYFYSDRFPKPEWFTATDHREQKP